MPEEREGDAKQVTLVSASALDLSDRALIKFGTNIIVNSTDVIKDFAKLMVTVDLGLFTAYFALLKFLGLGDITNQAAQSVRSISVWPPVLLLVSTLGFVLAIMPIPGGIDLESPDDIDRVRTKTLKARYVTMAAGVGLLMIAMAIAMFVASRLLGVLG